MRMRWFPWKMLIRSAARAQGFLDPILLLSRLRRFAQPSDLIVPTELIRSALVLHARGLINSQAIQQNLDWVWPYWVVKQFNPHDVSFVPRAFSLTHINLTHRNWTAVGLPDIGEFPLVDPRGLVTPLFDGWSLDGWVIAEQGERLIPSRLEGVSQELSHAGGRLAVITQAARAGLQLHMEVEMVRQAEQVVCAMRFNARAARPAWLVVALRPCNPEGISPIHDVTPLDGAPGWRVNRTAEVRFAEPPQRFQYSTYRLGDVLAWLPAGPEDTQGVRCDVGMATAAALFPLVPSQPREVRVEVPLHPARHASRRPHQRAVPEGPTWEESLQPACALQVPDPTVQQLYDIAVRMLILHSPGDVYPGPYTYRRFWFRDAALIIQALLCAGLIDRARRALDRFPSRQTSRGYFLSQEGEWDANGEALWIMGQFCRLTGAPVPPAWERAIDRGARWILRHRLPSTPASPHAGLLPAGFSAEHFGPNDYYYWDDFWAIAGLRAAAELADSAARRQDWRRGADDLARCVDESLALVASRLGRPIIPASPYRRMDGGAIGTLAASYPLQLWAPRDPRLWATLTYLMERCLVDGGFFQEISHSGINPYLTLHMAQVLLRAGDPRALEVMASIARLATSTGQWPEAVHPRTGGGCMGDGQHVWASAEWVLMVRNSFVREEGEALIIGSGIPAAWLQRELSYGPAPTAFGPVTVEFRPQPHAVTITWRSRWRGKAPQVEIRLPGRALVPVQPGQASVTLPLGHPDVVSDVAPA